MMNGQNSQTLINTSNTLRQVDAQLRHQLNSQTSNASASLSLNASHTLPHPITKKRMFQVRRTFLLIVTFDVIFMVLLWIIYNQIKNIPIDKAFTNDVLHYDIHKSLFDIVGLSALRFILLMIPYALLRFSHWVFVAFTTLASTGFIIAKTCLFTISNDNRSFTDYSVLIVSFIVAWVEIWFFDYRVIPHERRLREALNHDERRPLLLTPTSRSTSPVSTTDHYQSITLSHEPRQSFYSPVPSPDESENEETNNAQILPAVLPRPERSNSSISQVLGTPASSLEDDDQVNDYERQADETLEEVWKMFQDKDGWIEESKANGATDVVMSKIFPKYGKVFRLSSIIPRPRDVLVDVLFEKQEDMSKWNPTVYDCRILEYINSNLYISYQATNEQAQGMVAKRDFVNLTMRRYVDEVAILGAKACTYSKMPPKDNCVRGENGPTAYIIEKMDDNSSRFTWLLNVDLKGWLPQYLINSSLATVQLTLVRSLREYLTTIDITSSFSSYSSSAGDIST